MEDKLKEICPYIFKDDAEISEGEKKVLLNLILKTINFITKANIVPRPDGFFKWFLAFCYLYRKGIRNPTYEAVFRAYDDIEKILEGFDLNNLLTPQSSTQATNLIQIVVEELLNLIGELKGSLYKAKEELMGVIKKIPEKDKLTLEDALKLNEAIIKIRALEKDVEHVAVKLTSLEDKVRVLKDKMIKEPVSSVKSDIFKEMIEKLILRRKTTGEIFSLLVIRINDWERIKRQFPQNAILDYINRFCLTLKGELRATDIVSYIEEGTFAVALRDVSLRGGMKIAKRLKETMDKFFTVYKGEEISSRVNIAVVEGSPTDTYQSIIERAKKTLKICELDGGDCIRSELDLVGRE